MKRALAAVIAGATGTVEVSDRSGGKPIARLTTAEEVEHLAFAPGGKAIATGAITGVRLWSLPDGRETAHVEGGSTFAFSPSRPAWLWPVNQSTALRMLAAYFALTSR